MISTDDDEDIFMLSVSGPRVAVLVLCCVT